MYIIQQSPGPDGAFSPIQSWQGAAPPDGFDQWPDDLERDTFQSYSGFVITTVVRGIVKSYQPNVGAFEKWKAEQGQVDPEPEPVEDAPSWASMADALREGVNGV